MSSLSSHGSSIYFPMWTNPMWTRLPPACLQSHTVAAGLSARHSATSRLHVIAMLMVPGARGPPRMLRHCLSPPFAVVLLFAIAEPSDSGQFPAAGHPEKMGFAIATAGAPLLFRSAAPLLFLEWVFQQGCRGGASTLTAPVCPRIAIYDFGQNLAGYCIMRLPHCAKGALIRLRYAETTWPDANGETRIYNQFQSCSGSGSQCALQEDTYICSGKGEEIYEPTATYHGFRYVEETKTRNPL